MGWDGGVGSVVLVLVLVVLRHPICTADVVAKFRQHIVNILLDPSDTPLPRLGASTAG